MKKRRIRFLIVAFCLTLAVSALGAFLLRPKKSLSVSVTVTVRFQHVDNALSLSSVPFPTNAVLDGASCRVLSFASTPSEISEMKDGELFTYPSLLFSDITATVSLLAVERDGLLYADEAWLSPGKEISLSCPYFYGYGEILGILRG